LTTEPLELNICVTTPVGDTITCKKGVNNCPIVIEGRILLAKLAVFGMLGFDVILGMDRLGTRCHMGYCRQVDEERLPSRLQIRWKS
jgi:hypothetical protein